MNILVKDRARQVLEEKMGPEEFLRVTVTEGGCAGLTYDAQVDTVMKDGETVVFTSGSIRVVSDPESGRYLDSLIIDFSDELIGGGLKLTNSKAGSTCGCGASFNLSGFPVAEDGKCCN